MFRCCVKRSVYSFLWPFGSTTDLVTGKTQTETKLQEEIKDKTESESGWQRVRNIFKKKLEVYFLSFKSFSHHYIIANLVV